MDMFPLVSAAAGAASTGASGTLDQILTVVVPLAIFIMFAFMVYKQFTVEIDALIGWIRKQFAEDPNKKQVPISNPYMSDGIIVYQ